MFGSGLFGRDRGQLCFGFVWRRLLLFTRFSLLADRLTFSIFHYIEPQTIKGIILLILRHFLYSRSIVVRE